MGDKICRREFSRLQKYYTLRFLFLHAAHGDAFDYIAGEDEVHDEHGENRDGEGKENDAVIGAERLAHEHLDEHGERFFAGGVDDEAGEEEIIPACDELEDGLSGEGGLHDGEDDGVERVEHRLAADADGVGRL